MTIELNSGGGGDTPVDFGDEFVPTDAPVVEDKPEDKTEDKIEGEKGEKDEKAEDNQDDIGDKKEDKKEDIKDEPKERDEKGRFIPKTRFDLRTRQLRELENEHRRVLEENAALKAAPAKADPAPTVTDLDTQLAEIDENIYQARKDGDWEAERQLLGKSRKIQQAHFQAELKAARTQASSAAVESITLDSVIDDLEAAHPFLDPRSKDFDKDRANDLVELWEAYELKGYSKANALLKATALLLPEVEAGADEVKPEVKDEKPAPRKTDIKKNVDAARKTPPRLDDVGGLDSDKGGIRDVITPSKLSEKDFEALPDSVRAKLRGDYL